MKNSMRKIYILKYVTVLLTSFIIVTINLNLCKAETIYLNQGSATPGAASYVYMVSLADSIEKLTNGRFKINVVSTGASKENMIRMHKKQVEYGMAEESLIFRAKKGIEEFANDPMPELRNLFIYMNAPQPWMVTIESGINKIKDMNGKKIAPSARGTGSGAAALRIMEFLNVKPDWFIGTMSDVVDAARDRRIVGLVKTGVHTSRTTWAPDPVGVDINTKIPLKLIGYDEEEQRILRDKLPEYPLVKIPAGCFFKQERDVITHTLIFTIAATTFMSEEIAYQITKAMIEGKPLQEQRYPGIKHIEYFGDTLALLTNPLHVGAIKYFKEKGYKVPDRLIPSEMKK